MTLIGKICIYHKCATAQSNICQSKPSLIIGVEFGNRQTDKFLDTMYGGMWLFLSVKFATTLLASLAGQILCIFTFSSFCINTSYLIHLLHFLHFIPLTPKATRGRFHKPFCTLTPNFCTLRQTFTPQNSFLKVGHRAQNGL